MSSLSCMQFYIEDYLSGTKHLNAAQHGAYLLIVMNYIQRGRKPIPEKHLRFIAKCSVEDWELIEKIIIDFFEVDNGSVTPKTCYCPFSRPAPGVWKKLRNFVFERDGYVCRYCQTDQGPFEIDHILAVAVGGNSDPLNLCVACRPCNRSKKDKTVESWIGVLSA